MKRKMLAVLLAVSMLVSFMPLCSGLAEDASVKDLGGITLEVAVTYTGEQAAVFEQVAADFEAEYNCKVNLDEYGDDYENTMKTRMAANDLPDVWQTHGWSLLRYQEYLMDLSDQDWISDYDASALGVIQDTDGSTYVLMISELINGTLVDLDVCDAAGVDPYSIKTWDDFTAACAKVKEAGYTPVASTVNAGLLANLAGTWVSYEGELAEDSEAMLNGTWDWSSFKPLLETYANWIGSGYFFEDAETLSDSDFVERFASDKAAFCIGNDPVVFVNCRILNPDGNFALLPHFASQTGGVEFIGIGEGDTFGIWKDTDNEEAAKIFLDYLAQADVALTINNSTGMISCLQSSMALDDSYGLSVFETMKEKCADDTIFYENLWDRQYMPSGMWPIFANAASMLFADYSEDGIQSALDYLSENYVDLYEAAQ